MKAGTDRRKFRKVHPSKSRKGRCERPWSEGSSEADGFVAKPRLRVWVDTVRIATYSLPYRQMRSLSLFSADNAAAGVVELGRDQGGSESAHVLIGDPPLAVNEEGLRDSPNAVVDGYFPGRVATIRVSNVKLFEKGSRILFRVLDINPEKDDILILDSLPGRLYLSSLSPAGWAPRCPEVEEDNLAPKILKAELPAIEKRHGEGRSLTAYQGGLDISGIPNEAVGKNPNERENNC